MKIWLRADNCLILYFKRKRFVVKKRIATIGFFDGVHRGHRFLIEQVCAGAAERGLESLIVTFDQHPRQVIQADYIPQLLSTCEEKERLLRHTGVDWIEILLFTPEMSRLTAPEFMQHVLREKLDVDVLVMGYDHRFGHGGGTLDDYVQWGKDLGMEIVFAHELPGEKISSSRIRSLLSEGCLEEANSLLGRHYVMGGKVIEGRKVGRTMGFPTANLQLDYGKLMPASGVYAVRSTTEDGRSWSGVLNIGKRPTIGNGDDISVEVHLLHFTGDLYSQNVRLELVKRLRSEREFASREELQQQITTDIAQAREVLANVVP